MSLSALQENAKMLGALLGVDETQARERLKTTVCITWDDTSATARRLADQIRAIVDRTVSTCLDGPFSSCSAEVVIGNVAPRLSRNTIWVSLDSRSARIQETPVDSLVKEPVNGALSLITACYAAAATLKVAFGSDLPVNCTLPIELSWEQLFGADLSFLSEKTDIGQAFLAGAGAIGNAFILALKEFHVLGELHVCDPKIVTAGGLNRCLWFSESDLGTSKAEQICSLAQASFNYLQLHPHNSTVRDVIASRNPASLIQRLIVATDSPRVRRSLQNEFPREVFDASTTDVREFVLHFNHLPTELACLSCTYPETERERSHEVHVAEVLGVSVDDVKQGFVSLEVARAISERYADIPVERLVGRAFDSLFKELCGEGVLKTPEDKQVLAPFCFVSVLAGAYLAVEFVRRVRAGNTIEPFNYWRVSPWTSPVIDLRQYRPRLESCEFCSQPTLRRVATELWSVTRDLA